MRKLIYKNSRGESVEFYLSPFFIDSLTGIDGLDVDMQSQKSPYQDGETHIDVLLQPRYITLQGTVIEVDEIDILRHRRNLLKVCNPKLGLGELFLENDLGRYKIGALVDGGPQFAEKGEEILPHFEITFKCPNPYWLELNPLNIKLEDYTGNFRFPFRGPGIRFATRGDRRTVVNDGDSPAPIKVRFVGNAVNPLLKNETTGEYIKVNYTIPDGFEMHINTADGNKTVELVDSVGTRTNVFNYIDLASTFFKLDQGDNVLSFITEGGQPDVYIEFYNHYLGV